MFITNLSELAPELQIQLPSKPVQLHQTRVGFKHRWVDHAGRCHTSRPGSPSVAVDATTTVSNTALSKVNRFFLHDCKLIKYCVISDI